MGERSARPTITTWVLRNWRREHPDRAVFAKLEIYYLEESIYARNAVPDNYLIYEDPPSAASATPPADRPSDAPVL